MRRNPYPAAAAAFFLAALLFVPSLLVPSVGPLCSAQADCAAQEATIEAQATRISQLEAEIYELRQTLAPTPTRTPQDCGNDMVQRLEWFGYGQVIPDPPLPSTVRDAPRGKKIDEIPAGNYFFVLDGPECSDNGISWWLVKYGVTDDISGWISEGNNGEYFVQPVAADELSESLRDQLHYVGGMACPYVYTYDALAKRWLLDTPIIYRLEGAASERLQARRLARFDGRLLVREVERETSYLDRLFVRVTDLMGHTYDLETALPELRAADDMYYVMRQGDAVTLHFTGFDASRGVREAWVYAEGYYVPDD